MANTIDRTHDNALQPDGGAQGCSEHSSHSERDIEQAHFKAIVDSSDDAIISKTLHGIIRSWNLAAETMFGYTAGEMIGGNIDVLIPQDRLAEEQDILARLARGEQVSHLETVRRHKDGCLVQVSASMSPIRDQHGRVIGISKIARDITARKLAESALASAEAELRESQKMEALGTLAGGIAHDFNNMISIILGNAELALQDARIDPAGVLESVGQINKAALRARSLVQQILAFSRRQGTTQKPVVLDALITESVQLLRVALPLRLEIAIHRNTDLPPVLADAHQMQQIITNLVTNAAHAMRARSGRIVIRSGTAVLDAALVAQRPELKNMQARHPGPAVWLSVSDNGCGMDAATRAKIFQPFFTTKPVGEGTGLGLSAVHGIVQLHEGAITIDSTPGAGSTFTLYLPLAPEAALVAAREAAAALTPMTAPVEVGQQHILYLDDDGDLAFLVGRMLARGGFRVSIFHRCEEALAALRAAPASFDLVVTDYNMPGMMGPEVVRAVRRTRADLPVAVASGYVSDEVRADCTAAGAHEVLQKVLAVDDWCAVIARLAKPVVKAGAAR